MYSPYVTIRLVSSYLTFSPLPSLIKKTAVLFFYTGSPLRTTSHYEAECSVLPGLSSCITSIPKV
ncbi:hypothetical protein EVA_19900 [gut metagenome]|uniref:Uncharacterized protein n=1 Tax=gut metagenome TaxID=749906 RepID=J9FC36_9ZZZZ